MESSLKTWLIRILFVVPVLCLIISVVLWKHGQNETFDIQTVKRELKEYHDKIQKLSDDLHVQKRDMQNQIDADNMKQQKQLNDEVEKLHAQKREMQSQIDSANVKLHEQQEQLHVEKRKMQSQIDSANVKLHEQQEQMHVEKRDMQSQIKSANVNLEKQQEQLHAEITKRHAEKREMQNDKVNLKRQLQDDQVRLLNHVTWRTVAEFSHKPVIDSDNVIIYKESETRPPLLKGEIRPPTGALFTVQCKYELQTSPVQIPVVKPDLEKANPKLGVGVVAFSHDCRYMYTRNDNMPHTLWIWDIQKLSLAVILIQSAPIKAVSWDPCQSRLTLCTGNNKVYMWSPAGSLCVEVPVQGTFLVQSVSWHPDGQAFLLVSKTDMCVCFLNATAEQQQQVTA